MHEVTIETRGGEVRLETGRIGRQADGAVLLRHNDTVLLATAVAAEEARPGADFFPLTVEYRERLSAAGRIPEVTATAVALPRLDLAALCIC